MQVAQSEMPNEEMKRKFPTIMGFFKISAATGEVQILRSNRTYQYLIRLIYCSKSIVLH